MRNFIIAPGLGLALVLLSSFSAIAAAASAPSRTRLLQNCGQSCDGNGGCKNGSTCNLNSVACVWCSNCPAGFSGDRCEIAPAAVAGGQSCTANGGNSPQGACQAGGKCKLNNLGYIYCEGCNAGYTGLRCEIAPSGPSGAASCGQSCSGGGTAAGSVCQNGSQCNLSDAQCIFCLNCPPGSSGDRCQTISATGTTRPVIDGQVCVTAGGTNGESSIGGACRNGSTCTLTAQGYVYCTGCPAGYSGDRCQTAPASIVCGAGQDVCGRAVGAASSNPDNVCCTEGQKCTELLPPTGSTVLTACTSPRPCASNTCQNGGTCVDVEIKYPGQPRQFNKCTCIGGHSGVFCQN